MQILVDHGRAHAHVGSPLDAAQRVRGARLDAGKVLAQAAGLGARVDHGSPGGDSLVAGCGGEGKVRAGLHALAAFDAAGREIGLALRPGGSQQALGGALHGVGDALEGHGGG